MMVMMLPKMSPDSQNPMSSMLQKVMKARMSASNAASSNSDYDYDYDSDDYDYDYDYETDEAESQPSLLSSILRQITANFRPPSNLAKPDVEINQVQKDSPSSESGELDVFSESEEVPDRSEVSQISMEMPPSKRQHKGEQQPTEQVSYRNAP